MQNIRWDIYDIDIMETSKSGWTRNQINPISILTKKTDGNDIEYFIETCLTDDEDENRQERWMSSKNRSGLIVIDQTKKRIDTVCTILMLMK